MVLVDAARMEYEAAKAAYRQAEERLSAAKAALEAAEREEAREKADWRRLERKSNPSLFERAERASMMRRAGASFAIIGLAFGVSERVAEELVKRYEMWIEQEGWLEEKVSYELPKLP